MYSQAFTLAVLIFNEIVDGLLDTIETIGTSIGKGVSSFLFDFTKEAGSKNYIINPNGSFKTIVRIEYRNRVILLHAIHRLNMTIDIALANMNNPNSVIVLNSARAMVEQLNKAYRNVSSGNYGNLHQYVLIFTGELAETENITLEITDRNLRRVVSVFKHRSDF